MQGECRAGLDRCREGQIQGRTDAGQGICRERQGTEGRPGQGTAGQIGRKGQGTPVQCRAGHGTVELGTARQCRGQQGRKGHDREGQVRARDCRVVQMQM
jgi:hypothetical protein